jgi:hypothetical protein
VAEGDFPKHFVGIKPSEIVDDDVCVYRKHLASYEVMSIKNRPGIANIPAKIGVLPVTKIGSYALYGDDIMLVTAVNIPNSVEKILTKAFYYVDSLAFVNIPNSVEDVNHYAFYDITGTVYVEHKTIPGDWDSSWYYSTDYKLGTSASFSKAGDYFYETIDGKIYLKKYLLPIKAGDTIVVPTNIDGKRVYGVKQNCYESSVSNNSNSRINIVVSSDIAVMESYAVDFNNYYTYVNLYVDWNSDESYPSTWSSSWLYMYSSSSSYKTTYYAGQWELVNGVPAIK